MSQNDKPSPSAPGRKPRVFAVDDPALQKAQSTDEADTTSAYMRRPDPSTESLEADLITTERQLSITGNIERGFRWGTMLFTAATLLATLSMSLWFTRFVSDALAREDWVGWLATGLMALIVIALIAIVARELFGLARLSRLTALRADVDNALAKQDPQLEKQAVRRLASHYSGRPDVAWGIARLHAISDDVLDAGERLRLADREILRPLDGHARHIILRSAKRVATVTTLSPMTLLSLAFVLSESVGMFRKLATLYGGRPGTLGALRLGRMVVGHMVATGGLALTDDLFGQFLGQDMLRRLSRRLGEGAFNGALTARLGVAAVDVLRPIPPLDGDPVRVREIFAELFRTLRGKETRTGDGK